MAQEWFPSLLDHSNSPFPALSVQCLVFLFIITLLPLPSASPHLPSAFFFVVVIVVLIPNPASISLHLLLQLCEKNNFPTLILF